MQVAASIKDQPPPEERTIAEQAGREVAITGDLQATLSVTGQGSNDPFQSHQTSSDHVSPDQTSSDQASSDHVSTRIIGNVLMNWLALAVTLASGFLMSPFLVRHLGDSVYGVWVLIGSLAGYLGLLDFGVTPSIVKYTAEYRARGDQEALNRLVTGALSIYTVVGALSLLVSLAVAFSFNSIFSSPLSRQTAFTVVTLAGINLAVTFPASVFVGVVRGYQRYDLDAGITSVNLPLRCLVLILLIMNGRGLITLALVTLLFDGVRLAYLIRSAYRLNPDIEIARRYLDRKDLTKLFGYSFYAFAIVMGRQLIFYTDSIVIGLFLSTAMVTLYFVASRLVLYLRLLVSEMVGVLMPTTSDLGARNDQDGIRELLVISTKYMLLIAFPVAAVFFSIGGTFISLWMGPAYTSSTTVLTLLTIAMLAHFMEMPAHTVLLGLCKHRVVALFTLFQAIVNLALSVVLVRRMGIIGVALGTTIPMVAFTAVALVVYFRSFLKLPLGDYLRRSCIGPALVQLPFVAVLLPIIKWYPPASLMTFFSEIGLALIPYSVVVLATCVSRNERLIFLRVVERFGVKVAPRLSGRQQAASASAATSCAE